MRETENARKRVRENANVKDKRVLGCESACMCIYYKYMCVYEREERAREERERESVYVYV